MSLLANQPFLGLMTNFDPVCSEVCVSFFVRYCAFYYVTNIVLHV